MSVVQFRQFSAVLLSVILAFPQIGWGASNATTHLIFPGQPLPADLGYTPLKIGSTPDVDVQVMPRDWFLLKDKNLNLTNPTAGKTLDYVGPVLQAQNAQIYFRLTTGMILKESMIQAGFSVSEAKYFMDQVQSSGIDFTTTPLSGLGQLPKGVAELYQNWDRPLARMAVLPYLVLPLAVAYDQSNFQHFFEGHLEDADRQLSCSNVETLAPLGPVQTKIAENQRKMHELEGQLRDANSLLQASGSEQVRLSSNIKQLSDVLSQLMQCFTTIRERVARGANPPDDNCLAMAKTVMTESGNSSEWDKFVETNLKNPIGDFTRKAQLDSQLTALEGQITDTQNLLQATRDNDDKIQQQLSENRSKITGLRSDLEKERSNEKTLDAEAQNLDRDILAAQELNHKLETGELAKEVSDADVQAASGATVSRNAQLQQMKARRTQLVESRVKIETNIASLTTQVEYLKSAIDSEVIQANANENLINDKDIGLNTKLSRLQARHEQLKPVYLAAVDAANFSDYILSIINKGAATLNHKRDTLLASLSQEETNTIAYKKQIETAQAAKDSQLPGLQQQTADLQNSISAYVGIQNMGWFIETECAARKAFSTESNGVYLSRAKINDVKVKASQVASIDAGRWGLFNMDYNRFRAPIQSGILLNLPSYIQTSVQQINANYDAAMIQYLDPSMKKCADTDTGRSLATAPLNAMRVAATVWTDGNDSPTADGTINCGGKANANRAAFTASLSKLLAFDGSLLDQSLPQIGKSHPRDLIERQAISLVAREIAIVTGQVQPTASDLNAQHARRDALLKALIQVLAFDYDHATSEQRAQAESSSRIDYIFATAAPGPNAADLGTALLGLALKVGQTVPVKTLTKVKTYTIPAAVAANQSGIELSLNDQVQLLPIEGTESAVLNGWAHVMSAGKELWMPAWAIRSNVLLGDDGEPIVGYVEPSNCPHPHLVQTLSTFRANNNYVPRFANNLKTTNVGHPTYWTLDIFNVPKVSPAYTQKTYVACEGFAVANQVAMPNVAPALQNQNGTDFSSTQAIRLVEARVMKAVNGTVVYVPIEAVGGFVQTWIPENPTQPRLSIGGELDPVTWSLLK